MLALLLMICMAPWRAQACGDAGFAGRVGEAGHCGGGDEDGVLERVGEEGGGEVAFCAVDEDAGAEEDGAVDGVV